MKFVLKNYQVNTFYKNGMFFLVTKLYEQGAGKITKFITTCSFETIPEAREWLKSNWLGKKISVEQIYLSNDWKINGEVL